MSTVPYEDLQKFVGRKRRAQVQKWLESKGVLYFHDADGNPCTTDAALNEAMQRGRRTRPNYLEAKR